MNKNLKILITVTIGLTIVYFVHRYLEKGLEKKEEKDITKKNYTSEKKIIHDKSNRDVILVQQS